jgi:hypothetical protein
VLRHRADLETLADCERPRLDQLAGVLADDRGPENAAASVGQHLDETIGLTLGLGTVVLGERPAKRPDLEAPALRHRLV